MAEARLPGWDNLHRNLAAAVAERYAAGERWITVVTGDLESAADAERLRALHARIEAAVVAADYTGYERILTRHVRSSGPGNVSQTTGHRSRRRRRAAGPAGPSRPAAGGRTPLQNRRAGGSGRVEPEPPRRHGGIER